MKIPIPNPTEFLGREAMWFEQVELAFYHAKKAWVKIEAQAKYQKDRENIYPWIRIGFKESVEDAIEKVDPDLTECQEISISIEEL